MRDTLQSEPFFGSGIESVCAERHRGFESHPFRHAFPPRRRAIDYGSWGYRVAFLSGRADSAKHAIDARDGGEFACPIDSRSDPTNGRGSELMRAFHVVVEDWYGATGDDRMRALPLFFSTFKLFENAWFQQRQGALDPEQWQGWDAYIRMYYHRPGVKVWWQLRRAAFAAGFRDYVESSEPINELPSVTELIRGGT